MRKITWFAHAIAHANYASDDRWFIVDVFLAHIYVVLLETADVLSPIKKVAKPSTEKVWYGVVWYGWGSMGMVRYGIPWYGMI
jgi:hypothetical protein